MVTGRLLLVHHTDCLLRAPQYSIPLDGVPLLQLIAGATVPSVSLSTSTSPTSYLLRHVQLHPT